MRRPVQWYVYRYDRPSSRSDMVFWSCQTNLNVCAEDISVLEGLKKNAPLCDARSVVERGRGRGVLLLLRLFFWMVESHSAAKWHKRRSMRRIALSLFAQSVLFTLKNTKEGLSLRLCWCCVDIMAFQISDLLWSVLSIVYTAVEYIFVCIKLPTPVSASFHTL